MVLEEVLSSRAIRGMLELDDSTGTVTHIKRTWHLGEYPFVKGWGIARLRNLSGGIL